MSDFEQIEAGVISVAASTLTFTGISTAYKHLELTFNVHCTADQWRQEGYIQINGDSGSKYGEGRLQGINNVNYTYTYADTGSAYTGVIPFTGPGIYGTGSGNRDTNHTSTTVFRFFNYAGTTLNKIYTTWSVTPFGIAHGNSNGTSQQIGVYSFDSTAAITQISLICGSGNWDTGAKYMLAGYK